ncbi:MAG: TonB-dependent receptor [Alphaproteobacteria bacterium]|nr:TonB-dependent receptor [Alphaproteobacteria bacterium]MBV9694846.1 TonB-dependent receptor [Alphaproteobacteria bacterium]
MSRRVVFRHCALALLAASLPQPLLAQQAQGQGTIETVIVTATRRAEQLSKVPESISAFTSQRIEQLNAKSIADLVAYTPGVTFSQTSKDVSIRGVNSTAGDATTGIYIDDTPIQLRSLGFGSDNTLPSVFDLERVEVLRGPQGTLFGAGSEGGTVRYITPQPSLSDYSVYAKSEIAGTQGGAPDYEAGVAVGGPIVDDKLGFRVSGWGREDGGWIDKVDYMDPSHVLQSNTNYVDTYVGRAALTWKPTSALVVTPSVFYQNRHQNNIDDYWVGISNPDQGIYKTGTPENMADKDRFTLAALKADYDFGGAELISNTSYFTRHELVQDYSATLYDLSYFQQILDPSQPGGPRDPFGRGCTAAEPLCIYKSELYPLLTPTGINLGNFGHYEAVNNVTNTQDNFTQELRLQSTDSNARLTWIIGFFYSNQSQLSVEEINDPQLPALTQFLWGESMQMAWLENLLPNGDDYINHTRGHEHQEAVFANATYALTPALKVQVGARLAQTHFDFTNFSDGPQNFGPLTGPPGSKDERPFTPMAGITWQIDDDEMVYATWAKGYRIGGANPLFPVQACSEITTEPTSYNSDSVTSYEAGTKDKLFGGRFQASASVYYLKWTNIQQVVQLPSCGFRYTTNQGAAESKGFDFEGEWLVLDGLDFDFTLGFTDAHYTSTSQSVGLVLADVGDKLPGSPWTFSLGAEYTRTLWDHEAFVRLDYQFQGPETGLTPERDPGTTLFDPGLVPEPETNVLNIRAGTTVKNIAFTLFMDNMLNSHPQLGLNHQDEFTLLYEASTLRPRTFGLTATYRY